MTIKKNEIYIEIENLFIIILISFFISDKIKLFLTSYFICYLFIFFHELSHIIFASLFGKKIKKIKLSIAGLCVMFNNFDNIDRLKIVENLIIYIAGPISNICLAIIFYNIRFVFEVNIFLALLNLMPIFPLDGYNILKCILEYYNKQRLLKNIEFIFLSFLFLISIFVMIKFLNPSLFIFSIYIFLIKNVAKNHVKP